MLIDSTTRTLELVLGTAATTTAMPIVVDYVETTSTTHLAAQSNSASNGTTAVTILAAPVASTQRKVNSLTVYNADSLAKIVTIRLNDNTTLRPYVVVTLQVGETLGYTDVEGWYVLTSSGLIKTGADIATSIAAAPNKTTPIGADKIGIWDSVTGLLNGVLFSNLNLLWANISGSASQVFSVAPATASTHVMPRSQLNASSGSSEVGFIQSGTGAVARTIQSKNREWVTPYDFGAIGDGITDDLASLNLALAAVGSGTLYFPTGCLCGVSGTLNVSNNEVSLVFADITAGIKPLASMVNLINVTGNYFKCTGGLITNNSSYATTGIICTNSSGSASLSADISQNYIIGFTNGFSATGQNYNIYDNFFQNNITHIKFTNDGRNTFIDGNYILGGNIGISLIKAAVSGVQAEGTRITNNTILVTVGSGSGLSIAAGLEIYIGFNIIDQTGSASPGIYVNAAGTDVVSRLKIHSNWVAGGLNSYSIFLAGNNSDITIINNTITTTNAAALTAGLSMSGTNRAKVIANNFLLNGGIDISESGTSGIIKVENTATGGSAISNAMSATVFSGPITPVQTTGITGTTTNNNASAGYVGEVISSSVTSGSAIALTTATPTNITSISLTAGDWELYGNVYFSPAGTTTISYLANSSSVTSATFGTDSVSTKITPSGAAGIGIQGIPLTTARMSLSTTTTVYLVSYAAFAVSTLTAWGSISARRMR